MYIIFILFGLVLFVSRAICFLVILFSSGVFVLPYLVVFYDISDDRRRQRVARVLESLGLVRVQRSVFIGRGGFSKAKEVVRAATRLIDKRSDSVAAVVVPEDYGRRILVAGQLMNSPERTRELVLVV